MIYVKRMVRGDSQAGRRRVVAASTALILLALAAGLWVFHERQTPLLATEPLPSPLSEILRESPLPPAPPPTPTLGELSQSPDMMLATSVIEIQVERLHADWDALVPIHREALCRTGKSIRSAMHAHNNTITDLNHVQRAIYDITAPPGRCR